MLLTVTILFHLVRSQVIYVDNQLSWQSAEADCQTKGSHLLTAQGNQADIDECISLSNQNTVWIGLNRLNQNDWSWIANDITYNEDDVNWNGNNPLSTPSSSDCATLRTSGNRAGGIQNRQITCSTATAYCCNAGSGSTPSSSSTTTSSPPLPSSNCGRIRKEWNTALPAERNLYINGLLELSKAGKLQIFTQQHGEPFAEDQAHGTSAFFPWHRLFLFELETQIRNLGGEYECFALLYWNWGQDVTDYGYRYSEWSILNSGLGSKGDPNDNYCVTDGLFAKGSYTPYWCPNDWFNRRDTCCLRRRTMNDGVSGGMYSNAQMEDVILEDDFYGSDIDTTWLGRDILDGVRDNMEIAPHGNTHCTIGSCSDDGGHLGDGAWSPDDPVFYLLHGYVDYIWALWQDYNDYEQISKNSIGRDVYFGGEDNSDIDDKLEFGVLSEQSWSTLDSQSTVRDMHSIEDLGYKYEYGSFIDPDGFGFPTTNLNSNWFIPNSRRRLTSKYNDDDDGDDEENFDKVLRKQLVKQYGDKKNTRIGRKEMVKSLAKMSCEYLNSGDNECSRPAYYDDCSDMERGYNIYNNKKDINITLDELIEKVSDYPCMIETRKRMYSWVAKLGGLWRLCRGDYDRFCNREFLRKKTKNDKNLCEIKGYIKKNKNENNNNNNNGDIIGYGQGLYDKNKDYTNNEYNNQYTEAKTVSLKGIDYNNNNNNDGINKYEFNDLDKIILSATINAMAIGIVCAIGLLCYKCIMLSSQSKGYKSVSYIDDNDVEQK